MNLIFNKNNFNIDHINSELKNFCSKNNINNDDLLKTQLISEEFLSNILFPNYQNDVELVVNKQNEDIVLSFNYSGIDYMNKITETTIISLKILENKSKEIQSNTQDDKTTVQFVI